MGISKINAAVRRMDNNTQHNAALVEHAAAAASIGSLLSKAESLASAVGVNIGCARDLREAFSAKCRYPFICKPLPVPRLFDEFAIKKFVE